MQVINLGQIIEAQNLDTTQLAAELFPGNKYPKLALNRILTGEAFLDANQISRLSLFTGIPIHKLYNGGEWELKASADILTIVSPDKGYRAELNTQTWITKVYDKDTIFHEETLPSGSMSLRAYIEYINNLIITKK
jgi:hypothetical protein